MLLFDTPVLDHLYAFCVMQFAQRIPFNPEYLKNTLQHKYSHPNTPILLVKTLDEVLLLLHLCPLMTFENTFM